MKTWDDWSDFEINKAVVCALGLKILSIWTVNPNVFITLGSSEASKKVDYCNNPADMWPIILENNIVLTPCMGANIGDATGYSEHQNPVISEFNDNSKALRAAAIVFLMMNGVNPE